MAASTDVDGFDGKIALVTGGASGIGLASVIRLANEGCEVVVVDMNEQAGKQVAADLGGRFFSLDVGDSAAWSRLVDEVGPVDIAYLNAGVTTGEADIWNLTDEQYRRLLGANVDGVVFGTRALAPVIAGRGGGAIVVTASLAGLISFPLDPIYTLSKHAAVGFVRSVAPQLQTKGISINAICPGVVDTPLVGDGREMLRQAGFPLIDPDEIADAVINAITSGDTGQCWAVQKGIRVAWQFPEPPTNPLG